jgi:hypothetical protein
VAFHDPILRDVERFDEYREALRQAVVGAPKARGSKASKGRRRGSTQEREAARLRAERDFHAQSTVRPPSS